MYQRQVQDEVEKRHLAEDQGRRQQARVAAVQGTQDEQRRADGHQQEQQREGECVTLKNEISVIAGEAPTTHGAGSP